MCKAPKIPKPPPPPATATPAPSKSAGDVSLGPEAAPPADRATVKAKRKGRSALRADLQIPGGGGGLNIPLV